MESKLKAYFWEDEFEIEKGIFIPRPETEILVESFVETGKFKPHMPFRFLDWGTGSGIIAVTLAKLFPNAQGVACDLSQEALEISTRNAERIGVKNRLQFVHSDGLTGFRKGSFDVIFSNPPYVAAWEFDQLEPEVLSEPRLALDGGEDGLECYRKIFGDLSSLKPGGSLWLEIGWNQRSAIEEMFRRQNFNEIRVFKDFNQIDRIIAGMGFNG